MCDDVTLLQSRFVSGRAFDNVNDKSAFCLFDAQRLSAGPIARVQLPVRVPVGFHGTWVPDSALG